MGRHELSVDHAIDDSWRLREQEPTNLLALWPNPRPPTRTEIIAAIAEFLGGSVEIFSDEQHDDPDICWSVAVRLPGFEAPAVIWTEPAHPASLAELPGDVPRGAEWMLGLETQLSACDPLSEFARLMKIFARGTPQVRAVLDVNTARWHLRESLDDVFGADEVEPPADVLWVIQLVHGRDADDEQMPVWLHTHGLWRCGRPELEMLEVPKHAARSAAELINDIANLLLERPIAPPGVPFDIGTGLAITFQPWQEMVAYLPDGAPGAMRDRSGNGEDHHLGVRAVICGAKPVGQYRQLWAWPREVLRRLEEDEAGVYMTTRATERQAKLARREWNQFACAFSAVGSIRSREPDTKLPVFGVKAGFSEDQVENSREHLWFMVKGIDGDRVHGELCNQPVAVTAMTRGDRVWLKFDQISDWRVMTASGAFGPAQLDALWKAIDELKRECGDD